MKKLTVADVTWTLRPEPEDCSVRGNALASGDDEQDKACEDNIIRELDNGNEWAWCCAVLTGRYKGLKAVETLGCCSYASEADFRQPGGYFDDMQASVLADLQAQLEDICAV